jgi:hypothetical protein
MTGVLRDICGRCRNPAGGTDGQAALLRPLLANAVVGTLTVAQVDANCSGRREHRCFILISLTQFR